MTARTTAVVETWSTGLVEPERRLDYWIGAVCECFLEMDITTQVRADFDCSVQRGQLDTIGINRVQGSAQHVYRRKASVADQLGALLALGFGSEIPATPAEQRDATKLL